MHRRDRAPHAPETASSKHSTVRPVFRARLFCTSLVVCISLVALLHCTPSAVVKKRRQVTTSIPAPDGQRLRQSFQSKATLHAVIAEAIAWNAAAIIGATGGESRCLNSSIFISQWDLAMASVRIANGQSMPQMQLTEPLGTWGNGTVRNVHLGAHTQHIATQTPKRTSSQVEIAIAAVPVKDWAYGQLVIPLSPLHTPPRTAQQDNYEKVGIDAALPRASIVLDTLQAAATSHVPTSPSPAMIVSAAELLKEAASGMDMESEQWLHFAMRVAPARTRAHSGRECFSGDRCNGRSGPCDYCGAQLCCRSGASTDHPLCTHAQGGIAQHRCSKTAATAALGTLQELTSLRAEPFHSIDAPFGKRETHRPQADQKPWWWSAGRILPFRGGDIETESSLGAMLKARSWHGEIVITATDLHRVAEAANLLLSLRKVGIEHSVAVTPLNDQLCAALVRSPQQLSCAWSSWNSATCDAQHWRRWLRLVLHRYTLAALLRGVNVLALDVHGVAITSSPYDALLTTLAGKHLVYVLDGQCDDTFANVLYVGATDRWSVPVISSLLNLSILMGGASCSDSRSDFSPRACNQSRPDTHLDFQRAMQTAAAYITAAPPALSGPWHMSPHGERLGHISQPTSPSDSSMTSGAWGVQLPPMAIIEGDATGRTHLLQALDQWQYEADETVNFVRTVLRVRKSDQHVRGLLHPGLLQLGCSSTLHGGSCLPQFLSTAERDSVHAGRCISGKSALALRRLWIEQRQMSKRLHLLAASECSSGAALRRIRLIGLYRVGKPVSSLELDMDNGLTTLQRLSLFGAAMGRLAVRPRPPCGQNVSSWMGKAGDATSYESVGHHTGGIVAARCRHLHNAACCAMITSAKIRRLATGCLPSVEATFLDWKLADLAMSRRAPVHLMLQQLPRDTSGAIDVEKTLSMMSRTKQQWAEAPVLLIGLNAGEMFPPLSLNTSRVAWGRES